MNRNARLVGLAVAVLAIVGVVVFVPRKRKPAPIAPPTDASVLEQMREGGADFTKEHAVEFFLYFPTEAAAQRVAATLTEQGWTASSSRAAQDNDWLVLVTKSMLLTEPELTRIRAVFTALATREGGEYDGWGAPVVR